MPIVTDASIAASWMLADERNDAADAVLKLLVETGGHVPSLFWFEVRSFLLKAERRKRCTVEETQALMTRLRELPLHTAEDVLDEHVFALARTHGLSAYDATYLALALMQGLPLATYDRRLAESARKESITLLGPFAT